uniref:Uncharacterized protein n=1 Tax=Zea mays TaxID=4577 RepID=A0A804LNF0_MAIZE
MDVYIVRFPSDLVHACSVHEVVWCRRCTLAGHLEIEEHKQCSPDSKQPTNPEQKKRGEESARSAPYLRGSPSQSRERCVVDPPPAPAAAAPVGHRPASQTGPLALPPTVKRSGAK